MDAEQWTKGMSQISRAETTTAPERRGVVAECETLDLALGRLGEHLAVLANRLSPVLTPMTPNDAVRRDDVSVRSDLANTLVAFCIRIHDLTEHVGHINEALDL